MYCMCVQRQCSTMFGSFPPERRMFQSLQVQNLRTITSATSALVPIERTILLAVIVYYTASDP